MGHYVSSASINCRAVRPELGPSDKGFVAVRAGLNEGDVVATSGLANLADGAPVRAAAPKAEVADEKSETVEVER